MKAELGGLQWKLLAVGLTVGLLLSAAALVSAPEAGDRAVMANRFVVEIDGIATAAFKEVSGLDVQVEVIEYREGTDPVTHKVPGQVTWSDIVLKKGTLMTDDLWNWMEGSISGNPQRKSGSIVVLDPAGHEVLRYNFVKAFPVKWTGPTLNASGNELAVESIEIAHEGFERVTGP